MYSYIDKLTDYMYKTLTEKAKVFNQSTINTEDDLQKSITGLSNSLSLRFRGVCEAKYTMMTSLQRNCPASMSGKQKDYMSVLLQRVKNDTDVFTYFRRKGIAINDMSCLALMQHFGLPTPLLDFSTDIVVALSFAADGINLMSGSEETDQYVSLYVFDKVFEYEVGIPVQQVYMNGMVSGIQMWKNYMMQNPCQQVDAAILYNIDDFVKWNDIKDSELSYVEYQPLAPGVVTLSGQSLNLSNPNLDKQKGCFILNLYDENTPLEGNWNMRTRERRERFWMNRGNSLQTLPFSGVTTREKMACFDIKKEVIEKWAAKNAVPLYDNSKDTQDIKAKLAEIQKKVNEEIEA